MSDLPGVVLLGRNLLLGGAERVFVSYANHLRRFRPAVALVERRGELLGDLREHLVVEEIGAPHGPGLPGSTLALAREAARLARFSRIARADVVSSFLFRQHLIALAARRWFRRDLRVVLNVHEHMSGSATHLYPRPIDRAIMRWSTRRLFAGADVIVAVADGIKADLEEQFGVPPQRITVARNPLPVEWLRERAREPVAGRAGGPVSGPRVVGVGRLVALKGFDILLRAFAGVPAALGARLVLVGDGVERGSLEALARELRLGERVAFVGMQANPWAYMAEADLLVLPSRTEAFPNVLQEAMAIGTPVVATDCSPGVRELLAGGALVPTGDPAALADAITRLLGDPVERRRLAEWGRARVERYALDTAVTAYEAVLDRALSAPPGGSPG